MRGIVAALAIVAVAVFGNSSCGRAVSQAPPERTDEPSLASARDHGDAALPWLQVTVAWSAHAGAAAAGRPAGAGLVVAMRLGDGSHALRVEIAMGMDDVRHGP